jgi:hypothetical protein
MTLMLELRSEIVPSFLNHLGVMYITLTAGYIISPWLPSHHSPDGADRFDQQNVATIMYTSARIFQFWMEYL